MPADEQATEIIERALRLVGVPDGKLRHATHDMAQVLRAHDPNALSNR